MASLKDVAKLAGVSLMTVSRAIHNPEQLSPKTYQIVKQAIEQLNYVPNISAQKIRGTQAATHTIGVLSLDTATTPFSVEILLAIEQTVRQFGWHSFIINTFENELEQAVGTLISHRPSGIIFTTSGLKKIAIPPALRRYPIVLANCLTDDIQTACYVPNDFQGQFDAAQLLLEKGYHSPLCLYLPSNAIAAQARQQGFEQAWRANMGQNSPPPKPFFMSPFSQNFGEVLPILQKMCRKRPLEFDVVVCGNDRIALLTYQFLLGQGIRIPDEVAVLGFDNMVGVADWFLPPLTTVQLPHYEMGQQAALHLIEARTDNNVHYLDCPLVERASC
ncbi:LacI family DNA-binding transcriptional regulator [Muribacter muris]|uniref:LacI family DNA-binding transcriptional regulator n=2 Tax=Muribacter muris TaxID=67855 RepID=A0A4Y9JU15_9PAST|nr:LacI family DNA-binding transcriptional regulator [Muribacter muris]MBF0827735.1 LacI family DNA-binding transcriptional regulator [Muribacter muris]TFV08812.1 LacI family DNA-binding transcriptional regulator [Muribacter muris]